MITQNVGHSKSDAFHLVDKDNLVIDMTYSDPKAWGDKSWPGFKKFYRRVPKEDFQGFICGARENRGFDQDVVAPVIKDTKAK